VFGTHVGGVTIGQLSGASGKNASSAASIAASELLDDGSDALNEQLDKPMAIAIGRALTGPGYHRAIGGGGTT
jgi:hypothetical protein